MADADANVNVNTNTNTNAKADSTTVSTGKHGRLYSESEKITFMERALDVAFQALHHGEVPVGCVVVRNGEVVAGGANETNETMNPTRHAEFVAIESLQTPGWLVC